VIAAAASLGRRDAAAQGGGTPSPQIQQVRAALEKYQDPIVAIHDGYFSTLACVHFPSAGAAGRMAYPVGAMGVHFFNPALVGQPLDPMRPQVLLYRPDGDRLRLAGAEWFVPTAVSKEQPRIFDRGFDGPMEGHHPLMPVEMHHWDLHVWLWLDNPAGMFSPTNPALRCPPGAYSMAEEPPRIVQP
jgi:hypothetical protein